MVELEVTQLAREVDGAEVSAPIKGVIVSLRRRSAKGASAGMASSADAPKASPGAAARPSVSATRRLMSSMGATERRFARPLPIKAVFVLAAIR